MNVRFIARAQELIPMPARFLSGIFLFLLLLNCGASQAQETTISRKLIVGTRIVPPFVILNDNGSLKGISIDLWEDIARDLALTYEYRVVRDLAPLLEGLTTSPVQFDIVVGAVSVSSDREKSMDFSHPYFNSGLGIATRIKKPTAGFLKTLNQVLFNGLLKTLAWLFAVQLIAGMIIYFLENRPNPTHFGGGLLKGIGNGFWWSAVTMATVGYGDKTPRSCLGRLFGVFWMFTSIVIISTFTASISSSLTVSTLQTETIGGPEDLPNLHVGTYGPETTSYKYLAEKLRVSRLEKYKDIPDGLKAVNDNRIDVFVYDSPMLTYYINREFPGKLHVMPQVFEVQDYSFAFPTGSPLREQVNRMLLREIADANWHDTLTRYLGTRK